MDNNFSGQSDFNQPQHETKSNLSVFAKQEYYGLAKWVGIIAWIFTIFMSLVMLISIFGMIGLSNVTPKNAYGDNINPEITLLGAVFMIIFVVGIYFYPMMMLFKFTSNAKKAVRDDDDFALEYSIKCLRRHYKYIGILLIILMSFYALIFLFGGLGMMLGKML